MVDLIAQLRRAEKDLFNGENWAAIPQNGSLKTLEL